MCPARMGKFVSPMDSPCTRDVWRFASITHGEQSAAVRLATSFGIEEATVVCRQVGVIPIIISKAFSCISTYNKIIESSGSTIT